MTTRAESGRSCSLSDYVRRRDVDLERACYEGKRSANEP